MSIQNDDEKTSGDVKVPDDATKKNLVAECKKLLEKRKKLVETLEKIYKKEVRGRVVLEGQHC